MKLFGENDPGNFHKITRNMNTFYLGLSEFAQDLNTQLLAVKLY